MHHTALLVQRVRTVHARQTEDGPMTESDNGIFSFECQDLRKSVTSNIFFDANTRWSVPLYWDRNEILTRMRPPFLSGLVDNQCFPRQISMFVAEIVQGDQMVLVSRLYEPRAWRMYLPIPKTPLGDIIHGAVNSPITCESTRAIGSLPRSDWSNSNCLSSENGYETSYLDRCS